FFFVFGVPGETEVHELGFAFGIEQDVQGLDVAMQKVLLQRGIQSGGDLDAHVEHGEFRNSAELLDTAVEAAVIGQFHHQVGDAFEFIEGVNMYDIRVIEGGAGARLAVEAFEHLRVFGHFALEQLYGDIAFQCDIEGAEDCAHAAGCDDLAQLKLTNLERENDWMRTFAAGHGFQRWQI